VELCKLPGAVESNILLCGAIGDLGQKFFNKRPRGGKVSTGKQMQQEWERNLKTISHLRSPRYFNILVRSYQA